MPYELELIPDGLWIADQINSATVALKDFSPKTDADAKRLKILLETLEECETQVRQLIESESIIQEIPVGTKVS